MHTYLFSTETLKVILFLSILTAIFSCSKDTDLLAEYVSKDGLEVAKFGSFVMDDQYTTSRDKHIVLDVLSNDVFANFDKVKIVETSTAKNGIIVINNDNTLTYMPSASTSPNTETPETTDTPETTTSDTTDTPETTDTSDTTETPTTETPDTSSETPESTDTPETTTSDTTDTTETTDTPDTNETPTTETTDTSSETPDTQESETPTTVESSEETSTNEETSDTFTYTTEEENEDGTVTTNEGTVTVTITEESDTNDHIDTSIVQGAFYITTNGKSSNDGKSEEGAWPLAYAISMAQEGDVFYIKSGTYNSNELHIKNSGTSSNPIKFIGYTNTPNDIISKPYSSFDYGDTPSTSGMPILDGTYGARATTARINVTGDYIELYNLLVTNAPTGIMLRGDNFVVDNCVAYEIGRADNTEYVGDGIRTWNGDNGIVRNCHAQRTQNTGFWAYEGTGNLWKDNESYYVQHWETDYLFDCWAEYNTIDGVRSYRLYNGSHTSRALSFRDAQNSYATNIYGYNTRLQFQIGSHHNIVENMVIEGDNNTDTGFRDGAHSNMVKNSIIQGSSSAIWFSENGTGNNKFINVIFWKDPNNARKPNADVFIVNSDSAKDCEFINCTFKGWSGKLVDVRRNGVSGMKFINCNFVDNPNLNTIIDTHGNSFTGFQFNNNNKWNTGFSWPTGNGYSENISVDPQFVDDGVGVEKYKLKSTSPLIDRGISHPIRTTDYNGKGLRGNPDIGVYEH